MSHSIVILNMNGDEEEEYINNKNQLTFVCGYSNRSNEFKHVHAWMVDSNDEDGKQLFLHVYACSKGSYETVNKSELPPPLDTKIYYGYIALILEDEDHVLHDLSLDDWKQYYEQLYGGFEDIEETEDEDDEEEDCEEEDKENCEEDDDEDNNREEGHVVENNDIKEKRYTKDGYEIDDFVVDDDEIEYESEVDDDDETDSDETDSDETDDDKDNELENEKN